MNNFNRRSSQFSKRRELAPHAHSRGSHAFTQHTYINTVTTTYIIIYSFLADSC